jgi:microcystin-dependent protein
LSEPFLGEIKIVSFNFPPRGWALCNGQLLPINQNQALFALFGTMYGGNGQTTFALPDFRGRMPVHVGYGFTQGQAGGQESHTVTQSEMPAHSHWVNASQASASVQGGTSVTSHPATNTMLARATTDVYADPGALTSLTPTTITSVGGSQAHENRQPYLALYFIVALQGIFPSPN